MPSCSKGTLTRPHPVKQGFWQFLNTRCKKLTCDTCGPFAASRIKAAVHKRAVEHKLQRHLTLTLDPGLIPADRDSIAYINQVWHRFLTHLAAHHGGPIHFIRALELQKNGSAHFHVLIKETFAQDTLLRAWVDAGGGHQVRIRFRDQHRGADYVTKYICKELLQRIPKGRRRVTTSRSIRLFDAILPSGWQWSATPMWMQIEFALGSGFSEIAQPETFRYFEAASPPEPYDPMMWAHA